MTKTATLVKDGLLRGEAALYQLSEPMPGVDDEGPGDFEYVIVSAVDFVGGGGGLFNGPEPETYIFGADAEGNVVEWVELPGSFRGAKDHGAALEGAGYSVVIPAEES